KIGGIENAKSEMGSIQEALEQKSAQIKDLFRPGMRTALLVAVGLAVFQQLAGVSTLQMFAPIIFQQGGFPQASDAIWVTLITNVWNLACTVAALAVVDRLGRRPLLLTGIFGMVIGHV